MSILIKGMKLPDDCDHCHFLDYEQGGCFCSPDVDWYKDTAPRVNGMRARFCPLVEIPTPHGDLIDIDTIDFTNNDDTSRAFNMGAAWAIMQVARAKIVIESEE